MRAALRVAVLLALACASPQPRVVERCPDPRRLPPRPAEQCQEDPEAIAYQDHLSALLTSSSGPLALRVSLDEGARVASVCAEGTARGMSNARARRSLSAHLEEVWALPPGPSCLAGTRLDLDRRHALLVRIERVEAQCRGEMIETGGATQPDGGHLGSEARITPSASDRALAPNACVGARLGWLFAEKRGSWWQFSARARASAGAPGVLLFAPREGVAPPPEQARLVAGACARLAERDALLACVQAQRWELLE